MVYRDKKKTTAIATTVPAVVDVRSVVVRKLPVVIFRLHGILTVHVEYLDYIHIYTGYEDAGYGYISGNE